MIGIDRRLIQHFDWVLFAITALLITMGVFNLLSATHTGTTTEISPVAKRQLVAIALGVAILLICLLLDYRLLERLAYPLYGFGLLLVASTLVLAPVIRGSQSWLVFGPLRIQPAEIMKLALVIMLARLFHHHPPASMSRLRDFWRPGLVVALPVALILMQRDMGVAVLTLLIGATYLPFVTISRRAWLGVILLGVAAFTGLWNFGLAAYQRGRILDFLNPARDPLASGYQAIQSTIAVGSGGFWGKGYLEGTQTQLRFLPTQHTDFAFSVLAEEWGFFGSIFTLLLYLGLLLWGIRVALNSKEGFGAMLAVGIVGTLFWPAAINVAMVLGLAPVIGVPLPFFSYGGSVMLASLIGVGLLLNISMRRYMF